MGEEEGRVGVEGHRIRPPGLHQASVRRQRLVEHGEVCRTVAAREPAVHQRQGERGVRHVADERRVELQDVRRDAGLLRHVVQTEFVRLDPQQQAVVRHSRKRCRRVRLAVQNDLLRWRAAAAKRVIRHDR